MDIKKKIGVLVHIYDYLNGGYFNGHHQLQYYDENAYQLYLKGDNQGLKEVYNTLKQDMPKFVVENVENLAGIRYFYCDGCHDARIKNVIYEGDFLFIDLDTTGMLGCLKVSDNREIKIKTESDKVCEKLINDFKLSQKAFWINNDIVFDESNMWFLLELEIYNKETYKNIEYKFKISDIVIE